MLPSARSTQALEALEQAARVRATDLTWIGVEPPFRPLAGHPAFAALLNRLYSIPVQAGPHVLAPSVAPRAQRQRDASHDQPRPNTVQQVGRSSRKTNPRISAIAGVNTEMKLRLMTLHVLSIEK